MSDNLETDWFSKPSDAVRDLMRRRNVSTAELAQFLDDGIVTLRALYEGSRPIDATLAEVLSQKLGGNQAFWLKRQENFDCALKRAVSTAARDECSDWLSLVPSPSGRKPPTRLNDAKIHEELRQRLVYFNISKLETWKRLYWRDNICD